MLEVCPDLIFESFIFFRILTVVNFSIVLAVLIIEKP